MVLPSYLFLLAATCSQSFEWFDPLTPTGVEEKECIRHQALSGNGEAAYWLGKHYGYRGNSREDIFWIRLGAELGDCNATKAYVNTLRPKDDPEVQELIKLWRAKVRENC